MSKFSRAVKRIFRVSRKSRTPLPQLPQDPEVLDPTHPLPSTPEVNEMSDETDPAATQSESEQPLKRELATGELIPAAQCSTETIAAAVEDEKDCADEKKEVLHYRTRFDMMIAHLYVALSDNDCDIAALRTNGGHEFTHIVRLVFTRSANGEMVKPSRWLIQESRLADDGPLELRITCPDFALRLSDDENTALDAKQLLFARDYIATALSPSHKNDDWKTSGLDFPVPVEQGRVLILGPPGRQADVFAVFLTYLTFLTGVNGRKLLERFQANAELFSPWKDQVIGRDTFELAETVARSYKSH